MLSGTRFAVVASRLFQARTESSPSIGGIAGAAAGRDDDRLAGDQRLVADDDPALAVEPALAAEQLDAAFLEPGQLAGVVEVVDHLVAAVEDRLRVELAGHGPATPGTRRASASSSPGRSSAFEGMQA